MYNYQARSNPFAYRKPMAKKIPVKVTTVTADEVWGGAALADRVNEGRYLKEDLTLETGASFRRNRTVMLDAIKNNTITEADIEVGRAARAWHKGHLLMTAIKRPLSGFETTLQAASEMDEFALEVHQLQIATIASQIRSYREGVKNEELMYSVDLTPLAPEGAKVECQLEVIKSTYSTTYNITYIRGMEVESRKLVTFAYRTGLDVGSIINIKGTVKAHRDRYTQLARVRIV